MSIIDESLIGQTIDGRFLITSYLGMGAMGSAFCATQLDLNRDVCIKFLKGDVLRDHDAIARFKREARALASMQHPNIVRCYAFGLLNQFYPYLAMELIEGQSLKQVICQQPMTWQRTVSIMIQACSALSYAHEHGFVHRDVKPENIMLTRDGECEIAKIVDFGLVGKRPGEQVVATLTDPHSLVGTVNYMAPEAFIGKTADQSLDVYALGCVMYEALTGRLPFDADNSIAVMFKHANEKLPQLPSSIKPDKVRRELQEIIWKSTAVDPANRFTSCTEFSARLEEIFEPQPVSADDLPYISGNSDGTSQKRRCCEVNGFCAVVQDADFRFAFHIYFHRVVVQQTGYAQRI